jgi:hypothetical protein
MLEWWQGAGYRTLENPVEEDHPTVQFLIISEKRLSLLGGVDFAHGKKWDAVGIRETVQAVKSC